MKNNYKFILMSILILGLITSTTLANPLSNINAQTNPYSLVAFSGDFTCGSNAVKTMQQVANSNVDLFIVLGDMSYVDSNIDCFEKLINDNNLKSKSIAVIGNHEASEDGSQAAEDQAKAFFNLPSNGYKTSELNLGNTGQKAVFIQLYTQESIAAGSTQYKWLEQQLNSLEQRTDVKYVFVVSHKLMWDSNNACDHGAEGYADDVRGLLYQKGKVVDASIYGHDHCYMISKPLSTGDTITTNTNIDGVTYILSGLGGKTGDSTKPINDQTLDAFGGSNYGVSYVKLYHNQEKIESYFKLNSGAIKSQNTILDASGTIPVEICGNGIDDDGDGLIDENCTPIEVCGDGKDNDGDGKIDAEDPDCPLVPEICNNGLDDDRDGLKDGNDPDCQQQEVTKLTVTSSSATAQDSGKESQKAWDNDCSTRWSGNGIGTSITLNFDGKYLIKKILIDGYHTDKTYKFKVKDGNNPTKEYTIPTNRQACPALTEFDISDQNINATSLTIIGLGNSGTDYNSYKEIQVFGVKKNTPPPPIEICGDGIDNDKDGLIDEGCPLPPPKPKLAFNITSIIEGDASKIPKADLKLNETEFTIYPTQNNTKIIILGNTTVLPTSTSKSNDTEIMVFPHIDKPMFDPNLKSVSLN